MAKTINTILQNITLDKKSFVISKTVNALYDGNLSKREALKIIDEIAKQKKQDLFYNKLVQHAFQEDSSLWDESYLNTLRLDACCGKFDQALLEHMSDVSAFVFQEKRSSQNYYIVAIVLGSILVAAILAIPHFTI